MISSRILAEHESSLQRMRHDSETAWLFAVPSINVSYKQCDQVPEEFRRAGIGHCMSGEIVFIVDSIQCILVVSTIIHYVNVSCFVSNCSYCSLNVTDECSGNMIVAIIIVDTVPSTLAIIMSSVTSVTSVIMSQVDTLSQTLSCVLCPGHVSQPSYAGDTLVIRWRKYSGSDLCERGATVCCDQ